MKIRTYRGAGCLLFSVQPGEPAYVYLGLRKHSPGKGKWSIPGGKHEQRDGTGPGGEWANAVRETLEEITIDPALLMDSSSQMDPSVRFCLPLFQWATFLVSVPDKTHFAPRQEFHETGWFKISALPRRLAFGTRRAVRSLRQRLAADPPQ